MNKQEMAEWLAEHLLGRPNTKGYTAVQIMELMHFIYSPNGFFAVWDAVENRGLPIGYIIRDLFLPAYIDGKIECRYEAFYNAVYEAMKAL